MEGSGLPTDSQEEERRAITPAERLSTLSSGMPMDLWTTQAGCPQPHRRRIGGGGQVLCRSRRALRTGRGSCGCELASDVAGLRVEPGEQFVGKRSADDLRRLSGIRQLAVECFEVRVVS